MIFVEPRSVTIPPLGNESAIVLKIFSNVKMGVAKITRSACDTLLIMSSVISVAIAKFFAFWRVAGR